MSRLTPGAALRPQGCSPNTLQAGVEAQRAAGIMMVVAAGSAGPSCSTVTDPPSLYDASYTVGALNTGTDTIASFSSRGPVTVDGSMRLKPDISAPGTNTRSASNSSDNAYIFVSGTSMATPHIAGAVALLWSAHPELKNNPDATEPVLNSTRGPNSVEYLRLRVAEDTEQHLWKWAGGYSGGSRFRSYLFS